MDFFDVFVSLLPPLPPRAEEELAVDLVDVEQTITTHEQDALTIELDPTEHAIATEHDESAPESPAHEHAASSTRHRDDEDLEVDLDDLGGAPEMAPRKAEYAQSSLDELRGLCKRHSLRVRGTKHELVDRLVEALG